MLGGLSCAVHTTSAAYHEVGGEDKVLTRRQACCLFSQAAEAGAAD